jgi:predicted KAP-like P-loop ATPase
MSLTKLLPTIIEPAAPWKDDRLARDKVAGALTSVVHSIRQPFVISLESPYGTGKSFFVERWKAELVSKGYYCVIFDAWKSDFTDDPLFAFIASVKAQITQLCEERGIPLPERNFSAMAKTAAGVVLRQGLPIAAKGITKKLLGQEEGQALLDATGASEDEVAGIVGKLAIDRLKVQEESERSIDGFRKLLTKIVAEITSATDDDGKKKLIVLVDELDRCRPDFALKLLVRFANIVSLSGVVEGR